MSCNRPLSLLRTVHVQEEIYSSSYAAAAYLESINFNKKVCVRPCVRRRGREGTGGREG